MNSKRSYLDELNVGRQRRSDTAVEEINRTLDQLEGRLGRSLGTQGRDEGEDIAERFERISREIAAMQPAGGGDAPEGASRASLEGIARKMEETRRQEDQLASIGGIAGELKTLRDDMRTMMGANLRREFDALREELGRIMAAVPRTPMTAALNAELERLSDAIAQLAERSDEKNTKVLRLELEQVKSALASLAREETVRALDKRWDALEERLAKVGAAPNIERLGARLEAICVAVERLPETLSLSSLEERVRALAGSLDQFAGQRETGHPDLQVLIEERLDEISRAITASAALAHSSAFDPKLLERIEARISSLANQINELAEDRPDGRIVDRLNALSERVDEIARRLDGPEQAVERLAVQVADISRKLDSAPRPSDADFMAAMDSRFDALAARIDARNEAPAGIDVEVFRNLEAQVASLSAQLARPASDMPEFQDLGPRLDNIERAIGENRAAMMEAARAAAEQAIQALGVARAEDDTLREDLRTLEALTRKSEARNTKTFEAIHDTLLKIVERLSMLEPQAAAGKIAVDRTPSIDPAADEEALQEPESKLTPAEAAAAAARAALREDEDAGQEAEKRSMLGGLSRAFSARRGREAEDAPRQEPALTTDVPNEESVEAESEIDPERINEPLEPGSGAPNLNAIMRRVRDEREPGVADTAKEDFIAAARRAAQAAAAEAEFLKRGDAKTTEEGGRFSLGNILRRRKKTLLLALGATILVGGTYYAWTMLPQDGRQPQVVQNAGPAGERPVEEAAVAEAGAEAESLFGPRAGAAEAPPAGPALMPEGGTEDISTAAIEAPVMHDPSVGHMYSAALEHGPRATFEPASPAPAAPPAARSVPVPSVEAGPEPLREAAEEGNAAAFYEIGNRYAEGRQVEADMAEAARWYEEAAERGLAPAQYRIGNLYEKGIGVERDIGKAKMWYERAAEQGNASAMHNLGVLLAMGVDGEAENQAAARWFLEAAELGVTDSQFNLGILAARGAGVPRDLTEAYKWFDIVARSGDEDAAEKRDEVAQAMAPADLARARDKAKLWRPQQADPQANVVDIPPEWTVDEIVTGDIDMERVVSNIQLILNGSGFDAGPADGVMGARTRAAIKAFQKTQGMAETGEVDDTLVHALLTLNQARQ